MIWDDQHARFRADMVDAVDALDQAPAGTSLWAKAAERALAAYDACLYDVERLYPDTEWLVGYTMTGRLAHAIRPSEKDAQRRFVTYCGLGATYRSSGRWDDLSADIMQCSRCFEGLRKESSK